MANDQDVRRPVTRPEVYAAIDSERDYQIKRWGYRQCNNHFEEADHGVCDYIVYMHHYLDLAIEKASTEAGNDAALEMLRKVVTLGVACFEHNGIRPRNPDHQVVNARDGQVA